MDVRVYRSLVGEAQAARDAQEPALEASGARVGERKRWYELPEETLHHD